MLHLSWDGAGFNNLHLHKRSYRVRLIPLQDAGVPAENSGRRRSHYCITSVN